MPHELGLTPEDRVTFREEARRNNLRWGQSLFLTIAGALLLWWPTDPLVFAMDPHAQMILNIYRPILGGIALGTAAALRFIRAFQRHPVTFMAVAGHVLTAVFAYGERQFQG